MADNQIRFDDGAAYEQMMGTWSRLAANVFLDWLAPPEGLAWVDVGCGNGAVTELLIDRCRPREVQGIDPSDHQLDFARKRPAARLAQFHKGDAMALPFTAASFDAAVMALVIFFVPEPAKGVAEMVRVVRPDGLIAAYAWDMHGGGFPLEPMRAEMRALGHMPLQPPSIDASRSEVMRELWQQAGLEAIELREITVARTFASFDELWEISLKGNSIRAVLDKMPSSDAERVKASVAARLPADSAGRVTYSARANAVKGRVPR